MLNAAMQATVMMLGALAVAAVIGGSVLGTMIVLHRRSPWVVLGSAMGVGLAEMWLIAFLALAFGSR